MWFRKFEPARQRYPALIPEFDRLATYIEERQAEGQTFFTPRLVGAALGLNDAEAFVLLEALTTTGVLDHVYTVYCKKENMLLGKFDDADLVGGVPHCDYCDKDHSSDELRVEIAFQLAKSDRHKRRAA